jgi:hypothetical protein
MANGVRRCLSRRYSGYQELQEQCDTTEWWRNVVDGTRNSLYPHNTL